MKKGYKRYSFSVLPYPFTVHIFSGATPKEIAKAMGREKNAEFLRILNINNGPRSAKTIELTDDELILVFPKRCHSTTFAGLIAHECFHATSSILRNVGIPLGRDTDEAYAYLLQELVHTTLQNI